MITKLLLLAVWSNSDFLCDFWLGFCKATLTRGQKLKILYSLKNYYFVSAYSLKFVPTYLCFCFLMCLFYFFPAKPQHKRRERAVNVFLNIIKNDRKSIQMTEKISANTVK